MITFVNFTIYDQQFCILSKYIANKAKEMNNEETNYVKDNFTYGFKVKLVTKDGKLVSYKVYLHDRNKNILIFHEHFTKNLSRYNFNEFSNLYKGKSNGNFIKIDAQSLETDICATLHLTKNETLDLVFENTEKRDLFALGYRILRKGSLALTLTSFEFYLKQNTRKKENAAYLGNF